MLTVTGMFPSDFGVILFGTQISPVQLPNNCTIWTNYITGHSLRSDPTGTWTFGLSWPADNFSQLYVQVGSFRDVGGANEIKTSNCVHAEHK
jgi:hypothetical protein